MFEIGKGTLKGLLTETYQLNSKLFNTELLNSRAGVPAFCFLAVFTATPLNGSFCTTTHSTLVRLSHSLGRLHEQKILFLQVKPGQLEMNDNGSIQPFWERWRGRFDNAEVATAAGIYVANRWVKKYGYESPYKDRFYQLKDHWIDKNHSFLVNGVKTRNDVGRGILYVHWFDVHGFCFSLHSYRCPQSLLDGWAESKLKFGTPLTDEEIKHLKNRGFDFYTFFRAIRFGIEQPHIGTINRRLKAKGLDGFVPPHQHPIQAKPLPQTIKSIFSPGDLVLFSPSVSHPLEGEKGVVVRALHAAWVEVQFGNGEKTIQSDRSWTLLVEQNS